MQHEQNKPSQVQNNLSVVGPNILNEDCESHLLKQ